LRLYISGPMTGMPEHNRPEFNHVAARLRERGYEVVNPAELPSSPEMTWEDYMREDIRQMMGCQGVATLNGWSESRGARVEVNLARELKIPVLFWMFWSNEAC